MNSPASPHRTLVTEVDLRDPLPELPAADGQGHYSGAFVLVRLHTQPLGTVRLRYTGESTRVLLAEAIAHELEHMNALHEALEGQSVGEVLLSGSGVHVTPRVETNLRDRAAAALEGPSISVVVCTRNRPHLLAECIESLKGQDYHDFELVVVDNTDGDPKVEALVAAAGESLKTRYVVESHIGLSRARNCGTAASSGEIVAFLDDDATADTYWLAELASAYMKVEGAGSVNGLILPAALDTSAQEWLSQYGGHSKGRGFTQQVLDASDRAGQSPLYPLPPFGAGGNMSFRRNVLEKLGGFDRALGAGTPAGGAEETLAFTRLLLDGHKIVYRPGAIVWHRDHVEMADVQHQIHSLGRSLTAYYTALVCTRPYLIFPLAGLLPRGIRELRGGQQSVRAVTRNGAYPRTLLRAHRLGLVVGPLAYARGRLAERLPSKRTP